MRARLRRFIPWAAVLLLALPACQDNLEDEDLSDNIPSVISITPLVGSSDVTDLIAKDDPITAINEFIAVFRADLAVVTVTGDKRNPDATSFANDVILTSYTVQYEALDGISDALLPPDWGATISVEIPAGGTKTFSIEIVRLQDKSAGPLLSLDCTFGVGASCGEVRRAAVIVTFQGADIGGNPVTATGNLTIVFTDFGDLVGANQGLI